MLFEKDRYVSSIYEYIPSSVIREYDLSKANISVLLEQGLINQSQFQYYANLPKNQREVMVGCLQRNNPAILNGVKNGLLNARRMFFEANQIPEECVLYIDKDSITTINFDASTTSLTSNLNFRLKNVYTSFYRIFLVDLLYFNDGKGNESYRLKNSTKDMQQQISSYKNGILDFILEIAYYGQFYPAADTLRMINCAYRKYTSLGFNLDFYREFNNMASYKIKTDSNTHYYYIKDLPDNTSKELLDISYNANIFSLFYKIFSKIYFDKY